MHWYNVTFADGRKLRVEAISKVQAASRATAHAIRNKQEWIVVTANVTHSEPVAQLAQEREPELAFAE